MVLWPRSELAGRDLIEGLSAGGAIVVDPPAYRTLTVRPPDLPRFVSDLAAGRIAAVAFLSPSSVRGLAAALPDGTLSALVGRTLIASLGPATSAAVAAVGGYVDIEASERTANALAATIVERLTNRRGDAA
jgi:uroporphyrinogen-III synthase